VVGWWHGKMVRYAIANAPYDYSPYAPPLLAPPG